MKCAATIRRGVCAALLSSFLAIAACGGGSKATVGVSITPAAASLQTSATQQFTATVTGTSNGSVVWTITEGASGGSIDTGGLYTAPGAAGSYHVVATSAADATKSATATVTVTTAVPAITSVAITPASASLTTSAIQQFTAQVNGASSTAVTWSLQAGGAGGTISQTGLYTAPSSAGTDTVVATSTVDPKKNGSATVTVTVPPPPVVVGLNPASASLLTGGTLQFIARVTGSANQAVTWSLSPASGAGSIDGAGNYTAPQTAGTYTVIATSAADSSRTASAVVTVTARAVAVIVTPASARVPANATQRFVATVQNAGSGSAAVTWSVVPASGAGTIDATGLYTAPATGATGVQIVATSVADTSKQSAATVSVPALLVSLNPSAAGLNPGGTQQFTAAVKGASTASVTWSVQEGASGGTVDASGLYTAPQAAGTYHLVATSTVDNTQTGAAAIKVSSAPALNAAGGTVTDMASGIAIKLPAGAVDSSTVVSVAASSATPPPSLNALSPVYQFEPDGRVFSRPLTISLPLPQGVTQASVYWSRTDGSGYDALGGTIANGMITVQVPHFSQAVIGPPSTTRLVSGVGQVTSISATGRISEANDYSSTTIEALAKDSQGNTVAFPGTGNADGTFTIPNVPAGPYTLHAGTTYVVTDSSSPDLGSLNGGRPAHLLTRLTQQSILNLHVTNLDAWDTNDYFEFAATEANDWDFDTGRFGTLNAGDTTAVIPFDVNQANANPSSLIVGSRGDRALLAQESSLTTSTGVPYYAIKKLGVLPSFDLPASGTTDVSVAMTDVAGTNTVSVDYRASQWVALLADGNANHSATSYGVYVEGQAGLPDDGFYTSNLDLVGYQPTNPTGADVVTGPMNYAPVSALPGTWSSFFYTRLASSVKVLLPGTTRNGGNVRGAGFFNGADWTTTLDKGTTAPVVPPVGFPKQLQVAGKPFFTGGSGMGLTPALTWSAPTVGTATFYTVQIYSLAPNSAGTVTVATRLATLLTSGTSLTIPSGLITTGGSYAFTLVTTGSTSAAGAQLLATAPFKTGIDLAATTTVSGIFTP